MTLELFLSTYKEQPGKISTADAANNTGHNLNGKRLTLNPVNSDTSVRMIKAAEEERQINPDTTEKGSIFVTPATIAPIKISKIPSTFHSIVIMFLLSALISLNPLTTPLVGKRCAAPHITEIIDPKYISIRFSMIFSRVNCQKFTTNINNNRIFSCEINQFNIDYPYDNDGFTNFLHNDFIYQ
jgi:hypothetical protein